MRRRTIRKAVKIILTALVLLAAVVLPCSVHGAEVDRRSFRCGSVNVNVSISTEENARSPRFGRKYVLVRIPVSAVRLSVQPVRRSGPQAQIFSELIQDGDCLVTNGGFWGYDKKGFEMPLGLIMSSGRVLSPRVGWTSGGALCVNGESVSFMPVRTLRSEPACFEALQSKPLIVENSSVAVREAPGLFNRAAVGVGENGDIIVAGAFSLEGNAASLLDLASFIVDESSRNGSPARTMLALDGGPGAQLWVPPLDLHFGSKSSTYVPAIIRFASTGQRK